MRKINVQCSEFEIKSIQSFWLLQLQEMNVGILSVSFSSKLTLMAFKQTTMKYREMR